MLIYMKEILDMVIRMKRVFLLEQRDDRSMCYYYNDKQIGTHTKLSKNAELYVNY